MMRTNTEKTHRPRRQPTHPGEVLREDVMPTLGVTITRAAADMGISRMTLHRLLHEQTGVTPEMALRLGRYCGNGPDIWLRMQDTYDLWQAEQRIGDAVKRIPRAKSEAA